MEKKKKKKKKLAIVLILLIGLTVAGFAVYKLTKKSGPTNKVEIAEDIPAFGYTMDKRDSELFKKEFKTLKANLDGKEINYDEYAKSVAKLFIIDLYSIDNKINKYDVASLEYLEEGIVSSFKTKVQDTLYKYVDDNSYHQRKQELPMVKSILNVEDYTNEYDNEDIEGEYTAIKVEWNYVKDLEYDSSAVVVIQRKDKKFVVVEYTPLESE